MQQGPPWRDNFVQWLTLSHSTPEEPFNEIIFLPKNVNRTSFEKFNFSIKPR